jgi:hypothetical protein
MSWLTKLSNVSSHRGQYHGKYTDEQIWDGAQSSAVMTISAFYLLKLQCALLINGQNVSEVFVISVHCCADNSIYKNF